VAPHLRRAGYRPVLAPSVPYGASPLAETWPGTVSLSVGTLRRLIVDVIDSLARHGFRRFVLANYQADPGQLRAMAEAKRALTRPGARRRPRAAAGAGRLQVLFAGFSPETSSLAAMLNPAVLRLSRSPNPKGEWHAGELETALVLARRPRLVRRGLARRLPPAWGDFRRPPARGGGRGDAGRSRRAERVTSAGPRPRRPPPRSARWRCGAG